MAIDFSKFDKMYNSEQLAKDVEEVAKNGGTGTYEDVPEGLYAVAIEKMELTESRKGDPMLSVWFKIRDGKFKGSYIFMNQVITRDFQIHIVNEFLRSLDSGVDEIKFVNYSQYNQLILDIAEAIDSDNLSYDLRYGKNAKGYSTFEIESVYDD